MKKYGDDADSFHDQGTRVEISKQWHEQNTIKPNYNYHSSSKTTNKTTYEPSYSYSQHRKRQSRTSSYGSYNNQGYQKRQSYRVLSVEEANRRIKKQNKRSTQSSSSGNSSRSVFSCCIGIFICFLVIAFIHSFDNYVGIYSVGLLTFFGIFIGVFFGIVAFVLVDDWLDKKPKDKMSDGYNYNRKNNKFHPNYDYSSTLDWKICPKCGRKYDNETKKCSYCGYKF